MPQEEHQCELIVTAKTSTKNQQKKGFLVTNLKLCNSFVEVLPFRLEWNNCDTKFYKDAKLTELHKKRKNNNRSKNEIRKTAKIKSKAEMD